MPRRSFDKAYYDRFYRDARTRVATRSDFVLLGRFVCSYLKYVGQPVESVLDLGCGLGHWREIARRHFPRASYTGVEISPYLCREYGWERGSVVDYGSDRRFDLVICQGVLQYLDAGQAKTAIRNLGRLCRGALYLEVLTREDWTQACDQERTDGDVYLRDAAWYRRELGREFAGIGGGVLLSPDSPAVVYALERSFP